MRFFPLLGYYAAYGGNFLAKFRENQSDPIVEVQEIQDFRFLDH